MDFAGEEGACRQHHGIGTKRQTHLGDHTCHSTAVKGQIVNSLLKNDKIFLRFEATANVGFVQRAVRLTARRTHRRAFGGIQNTPLDAGTVGGLRHHPAERIDFLDQMPLADATDRRIAAHLADRFDIVAEQQGARTGTRRGQCGLGAGVAATDDDYLEGPLLIHFSTLDINQLYVNLLLVRF